MSSSFYHHIQTLQLFPHHKLNIGNALGSVGSNVPDGRSHRVHELLQKRYHYQRLTQEGYPSIGPFKEVNSSFEQKGPTHPVKEGHDGNGRSNAGAGGEQVKEQTEVPDEEFGFECGNLSWSFLPLANLLL